MYQIVLILLTAVSGSLSQIFINGSCPITNGSMATDNFYSIGGTWYQIERVPNSDESGDCSTTLFSGLIVNAMSNREVVNQREVYNNGTIALRPVQPYRFAVTFSSSILPREYYLIGTDFRNYALIGRCDEFYHSTNTTTTNLFGWKLSRTNSLTAAANTTINQHLAAIPALASATWRRTSHTTDACHTMSGAGSLVSSFMVIVAAVLFAAKENFE